MNVLYLYKEEWEENYVSENLKAQNVKYSDSIQNVPVEILKEVEAVSNFVNHPLRKEGIEKMPNLKLITTRSTGFDHIDIAYAREKGIEVLYVPSYGENTVAEFAFALLLALARKICEADSQVEYTGSLLQAELRGVDLQSKTIGVIGTGRIGMHMVKMAQGFGMTVIAHDPFPKENVNFQYVSLEELLAQSDFITLHCMLTPENRHLINTGNISKIKRGAFLVNTARGPLIETAALIKGLEEGILAGAGLDVLEEENAEFIAHNQYLIKHPRVIVTPHVAFNTEEAVKRILDTTIDNILSFAQGETKNRVPLN
jgi:D-lactate dehydrogenase